METWKTYGLLFRLVGTVVWYADLTLMIQNTVLPFDNFNKCSNCNDDDVAVASKQQKSCIMKSYAETVFKSSVVLAES